MSTESRRSRAVVAATFCATSSASALQAQCTTSSDFAAFYDLILRPQAQSQFDGRLRPMAAPQCTPNELREIEAWYVEVLFPGYADTLAQLSDCPSMGYAEMIAPSTRRLESQLTYGCFDAATRAVEVIQKEQACQNDWTQC